MNRRSFIEKLGAVPLGVAAASMGIVAIAPEPSLSDLMVRAFHRLGRQVGKTRMAIYAHPNVIRDMRSTHGWMQATYRKHWDELSAALKPTRPL